MTGRLTLAIKKPVIDKARSYADSKGISLSMLIESYLETLTQENGNEDLSPKLKKIVGAVKLPRDFDEDKELRASLEKKHLWMGL